MRVVTETFLDANLIVLLIVGTVSRERISQHKRTRRFPPEDYDRLLDLLERKRVFVTPNTLTEASNLLKPRHRAVLRTLIEESTEEAVSSAAAARSHAFPRLGLTDAALLEVISVERPLLTVDFDLYAAALSAGEERAFNFTHLQDW